MRSNTEERVDRLSNPTDCQSKMQKKSAELEAKVTAGEMTRQQVADELYNEFGSLRYW